MYRPPPRPKHKPIPHGPKPPSYNTAHAKNVQKAIQYGHNIESFRRSPLGKATARITAKQNAEYRRKHHPAKIKEPLHLGFDIHAAIGSIPKTARDLRDTAYYTPGGIVKTVETVGGDTLHPSRGFRNTRRLGRQIGTQFVDSFRWKNAREHPGIAGLNLYAAATAGAGGVTRLGARSVRLPAAETSYLRKGNLVTAHMGPKNPLLRPVFKHSIEAKQAMLDLPDGNLNKWQKRSTNRAMKDMRNRISSEARIRQDLENKNPYQHVLSKVYQAGTKTKEHTNQIPVKVRVTQTGEKIFTQPKLVGPKNRPGIPHEQAAIGSDVSHAGIRWVDKRLIPDIRRRPTGPIEETLARTTLPLRTFGVYARPAYIATNYAGNVGMGLVRHGPRIVKGFTQAYRHKFGEDVSQLVRHAMGTARTESIIPEGLRGIGKKYEEKFVSSIAGITDSHFREATFYRRAAEHGYDTREKIIKLLSDPKLSNKRDSIIQMARDDAVDFSKMGPREKSLTSVIYFYPWLKGATRWTGQAIAQHPIKTAGAAAIAQEGKRENIRMFGPTPKWAAGFIPVAGGSRAINPASAWTPTTVAQYGDFGTDYAKNLMSGLGVPGGQRSSSGRTPFEEFGVPLLQVLGSSDPGQSLSRQARTLGPLGVASRAFGWHSPKTYSGRGIGEAVGPFMFGGFYPRQVDKNQFHDQAARDLAPPERLKLKSQNVHTVLQQAIQEKTLGPDTKYLKEAMPIIKKELNLNRKRYTFRAEHGAVGTGKSKEKFIADVQFLVSQGKGTSKDAKEAIEWAKTASPSEIASAQSRLSRNFFGTPVLSRVSTALKDKGVKITVPSAR